MRAEALYSDPQLPGVVWEEVISTYEPPLRSRLTRRAVARSRYEGGFVAEFWSYPSIAPSERIG